MEQLWYILSSRAEILILLLNLLLFTYEKIVGGVLND